MEESTILAILLALILLKIILPPPAIEQDQKIGFAQFRCNGRPYLAKIIGDGYFMTCVLLPALVILAPPLGVAVVFCPLFSPAVYLLMKSGTDRTIRFCASAVLAAGWFLIIVTVI